MKFDKADYKGERVLFDLSALAESPTFKSFPTCKISQSRLKLHHMKYSKEEDFSLPMFASIIIVTPPSSILHEKSTLFPLPPSLSFASSSHGSSVSFSCDGASSVGLDVSSVGLVPLSVKLVASSV